MFLSGRVLLTLGPSLTSPLRISWRISRRISSSTCHVSFNISCVLLISLTAVVSRICGVEHSQLGNPLL